MFMFEAVRLCPDLSDLSVSSFSDEQATLPSITPNLYFFVSTISSCVLCSLLKQKTSVPGLRIFRRTGAPPVLPPNPRPPHLYCLQWVLYLVVAFVFIFLFV